MPNNRVWIAVAIAAIIFVGAVAFAIGQRTTCFNFMGMAQGCVVDTTRPH